VTVGKLIERLKEPLQLEQLAGTDGKQREIENPDVSSPGLALAGYVGRFTAERVQILGETEITYLSTLGEVERRRILTQFFAFPIPCVFITKGLEAVAPLVELAHAAGVPVLRSPRSRVGPRTLEVA
jgi:HPr kinase/phosphorylase